jgi:hypothetical protein
MSQSIVDAESVLVLDVGSVNTRAILFDVVDDQYRYIASSRAASTANAPFFDISEGALQAILRLQEVTARFFTQDAQLVLPTRPDGVGIDQLVITYSAGPMLQTVVLGLLEDVSLESARRLATSAQTLVVDAIGLNDHRKPEMQIDAILKANPNLLIIAGGTERGATRSIAKMIELVGMALQVLPRDSRPEVVFAGNQAMVKHISETLGKFTTVHTAPNIRPSIEIENLKPAREVTAQVIRNIRTRQLGGLQSFASICAEEPALTSSAFGRMVHFLAGLNSPNKTVLGVDIGASYTTLASATPKSLHLSSLPMGMGGGMLNALPQLSLPAVMRWLPIHIPPADVRDYLWQKTLYPDSIPASVETLAIEQAAAREILATALRQHQTSYPANTGADEPILASGAVISSLSPANSLLTILDGIQPWGVTTVILDPYGLASALGAVAAINALLPVQVLESSALLNLGTVISPVSSAKFGAPILKVKIEYEAGEPVSQEIRQGTITMLPVQPGQAARIHLQPLRSVVLDPTGKESFRSFKVIGGACGTVIDARGRPLQLVNDDARRRDMLKKWVSSLGG